MKYRQLGRTGLQVSQICLGCMSFGGPTRGKHSWTLPEEQSRAVIRQALEAGINFFDLANVYSDGGAEEIVGRALNNFACRDEIVIATKVQGRVRPGPNGGGLSRKAILAEIDASLRRLGTDHIDLYQIHRPDPLTPAEETLEALNDIVRAGKVRYIGACSMPAWQFVDMVRLAQAKGWASFVSMQNYYNLLYREEEREMLPFCAANGIGVMSWSPLARGRLARPWQMITARSHEDEYARVLHRLEDPGDRLIVERLAELSERLKLPMAQIALAWLLERPCAPVPIVGVSQDSHLDDALAAVSLNLDASDIAALDNLYVPHAVVGH